MKRNAIVNPNAYYESSEHKAQRLRREREKRRRDAIVARLSPEERAVVVSRPKSVAQIMGNARRTTPRKNLT